MSEYDEYDFTDEELADARDEGGSVHAELVAERNRLRAELVKQRGAPAASGGGSPAEALDEQGDLQSNLSDVTPSVVTARASNIPTTDANGMPLSTEERFKLLWQSQRSR